MEQSAPSRSSIFFNVERLGNALVIMSLLIINSGIPISMSIALMVHVMIATDALSDPPLFT
jgi:hypothetical protein